MESLMKKLILIFDIKLDNAISKIKKNRKILILVFTTVFIVGLFSYCYIYLNPSYSHDGLGAIDQTPDDSWKISLGRYLQPLFRKSRGPVGATWLIGILSLVYLSLSSIVICKIFNFKSKISVILTSSILTLNMSISLTFLTYCHEGDMFTFSILLASIAVYILKKYRKYGYLLGSVFVACSLGLYQAYLSIPICLVLLLTIKYLLQDVELKKIMTFIFKGIIMVILGTILYYVGVKIACSLTNIPLSDGYNSIKKLDINIFNTLFNSIRNIYSFFHKEFMLVYQTSPHLTSVFKILSYILILICLILLIWSKKITKNKFYYIFIIIIVLIYPIFANISGIASGCIHSLMTYGNFLILFIPIIINENSKVVISKKSINCFKYITCIILIFMLYRNAVYSNALSLKKYFSDRTTYSTMIRIVKDIENIDEFATDRCQIYFIGDLESSSYFDIFPGLEKYNGTGFNNIFSITYISTYYNYLKYNFALDISQVSYDIVVNTIDDADNFIDNMSSFPKEGYIKYRDGIILIKLSN